MYQTQRLVEDHISFPLVINIELTDICPLNCLYCYKNLDMMKNIDFVLLNKNLEEYAQNGGRKVMLSGGEPLLYSHLIDTIKTCKKLGLITVISTSGYGLDSVKLKKLFSNGLDTLFISLNSNIKKINALSRDGYEHAVRAMELCKKLQFPYRLNTVVRHDNLSYLEELIKFAKAHGAAGMDLLSNKPNSNGDVSSSLTKDDIKELILILGKNEDYLRFQTCFIPLKTYFNKFSNNRNLNKILKGCTAGRYSMTIFSDGMYAPCPHSQEKESYNSIMTYWEKSKVLLRYRKGFGFNNKKCSHCTYREYCAPCITFPNYNYCLSAEDGEIEK